jgi:hypothetical protein
MRIIGAPLAKRLSVTAQKKRVPFLTASADIAYLPVMKSALFYLTGYFIKYAT